MPTASTLSFVHCADLHLDSPFEGIRAVDPGIARALQDATFTAFDRVVDLAIGEKVDALIVAGDVYDGADRSLRAQLRFRQGIIRAAESGVSCFVAHGNHDPLSGWEAQLAWPAAVHRFGAGAPERVPVERGGEALAYVYGMSYPVRAVADNLAARFKRDGSDAFSIGVLHCNAGGNTNHDNYAPCTIDDLTACGMDYWALGHVHTRTVLSERPWIVYPGNTQGRSPVELGERGCYLVHAGPLVDLSVDFVPTDAVRWYTETVDVSDISTADELLDVLASRREEVRRGAGGRGAILRLRLTGRGGLHSTLARPNSARDLTQTLLEGESDRPDFVWIESLGVDTRPPVNVAQRRQMEDFVGDFLRTSDKLRNGDVGELRALLARRPEHVRIEAVLDDLPDAELGGLLDAAEALGLDNLLEQEG